MIANFLTLVLSLLWDFVFDCHVTLSLKVETFANLLTRLLHFNKLSWHSHSGSPPGPGLRSHDVTSLAGGGSVVPFRTGGGYRFESFQLAAETCEFSQLPPRMAGINDGLSHILWTFTEM